MHGTSWDDEYGGDEGDAEGSKEEECGTFLGLNLPDFDSLVHT